MVKIADIGDYDTLPPLAAALLAGDTAALDGLWAEGFDLDAEITLSQYTKQTPLALALAVNAQASLQWLIRHGVNLNRPDYPAFPIAARYADAQTLRELVQQGADVDAEVRVGGDAYLQAIYGGKTEHLPVIEALGHSVRGHGGHAFRSAVFRRDRKLVDFFLAHGVDVDFQEPDQVFPDGATPLLVAVRKGDGPMCRLLVEHGADVLRTNDSGDRPYTEAVQRRDRELAAYFKALEPAERHDLAHKLRELEPYRLPPDLLEFLQGDQRRIEAPGCDFGFVEFFSLLDTFPMDVGPNRLLRLSCANGDYAHLLLVWNPATACIGYWDLEHEAYGDVASFQDFMASPSLHLDRVLDGGLVTYGGY